MTPEEKKEKQKLYYQLNKERIKERDKQYREANKELVLNKKKQYREANKDKLKQYREANKDKLKQYREENKERINKVSNVYRNNRKKEDSLYKLKFVIRTAVSQSIKKSGYKKLSKTEIILGCTFDELKIYLESKFEDWMNWENYGKYNGIINFGWDIDHKIPLASATCEADIIRLNHYSNLQPLCSYTNRDIKRDNV